MTKTPSSEPINGVTVTDSSGQSTPYKVVRDPKDPNKVTIDISGGTSETVHIDYAKFTGADQGRAVLNKPGPIELRIKGNRGDAVQVDVSGRPNSNLPKLGGTLSHLIIGANQSGPRIMASTENGGMISYTPVIKVDGIPDNVSLGRLTPQGFEGTKAQDSMSAVPPR